MTSPGTIQNAAREWLPPSDEPIVIDRATQTWNCEGLAAVAPRSFCDGVSPARSQEPMSTQASLLTEHAILFAHAPAACYTRLVPYAAG